MERRATYSSHVDPDTNSRRRSLNLSSVQWWAVWVVSVGGALGILFAAFGFAVEQMREEADHSFRLRLEKTLQPPQGMVYKEIDTQIRAHEVRAQQEYHIDMQALTRRIDRNTWILEELYEQQTGRKPPALPQGE